tara:strand:- start:10980 stop:11345 length:366 start_codon:yes stop_codon:yes gene_type:complete
MAVITLTFTQVLNVSLQVGDTIYYVTPDSTTPYYAFNQSDIIKLGVVQSIGVNPQGLDEITVDVPDDVVRPSQTDYILFSKDATANMSSLLGYFAEAEFVNDSNIASEIFAVNSEIVESSK